MAAAEFDRFLAGVDALPGLTAVAAGWDAISGPGGLAAGRPFLRPRAEPARSVPGPDGGLPLEVVEHAAGDLVGVCPETGRVVPLTREDLVVYELDRGRLARAVGAAFGLDPGGDEPAPGRVADAGRLILGGGSYPCRLAFPQASDPVEAVAARLVAAGEAPFVLLAPTRRWAARWVESQLRLRQAARWVESQLRLRQSAFVPLVGDVSPAGPGRLRAVQTLADLVAHTLGVVAPAASPTDLARNSFREMGEGWLVVFAGRRVIVKSDLGVRYLAYLIARKHRPVPAAELKAVGASGPLPPPDWGAEMIDATGFRAARDEFEHWTEELAEAQRINDIGRSGRAQEQLGLLAGQMHAATGLGKRRRRLGDKVDSIRVAIKQAIERVVGRLAGPHSKLARHFSVSVQTGDDLTYSPVPDVE